MDTMLLHKLPLFEVGNGLVVAVGQVGVVGVDVDVRHSRRLRYLDIIS